MLCVRDVHKRYRRGPVLRGVSLDLYSGQLVGIVGQNGAGKSALLRILAGDLAPDAGTVERRGVMGTCPQDTVLHSASSVEQHLQSFRAAYGLESPHRAVTTREGPMPAGSRVPAAATGVRPGLLRAKRRLLGLPRPDHTAAARQGARQA
ncbi:ATP-binding cassette domain-containing protein [Streptomyces sp. NPDC023838]|uniref:ATP-binding cassette domain-containing protein n=1 Tax=Streptomyces sp. NPDC023838 TaxID=3154325 RepID=UPI0033FC1943